MTFLKEQEENSSQFSLYFRGAYQLVIQNTVSALLIKLKALILHIRKGHKKLYINFLFVFSFSVFFACMK